MAKSKDGSLASALAKKAVAMDCKEAAHGALVEASVGPRGAKAADGPNSALKHLLAAEAEVRRGKGPKAGKSNKRRNPVAAKKGDVSAGLANRKRLDEA